MVEKSINRFEELLSQLNKEINKLDQNDSQVKNVKYKLDELDLAFQSGSKKIFANATKLDAILNNVIDAIITIDSQGRIETVNNAVEDLFGYKPAEVIGKNVSVLMPEPYKSEHDDYINNYLSTGRKKIIGIGRKVTARKKNGETFPIFLSVGEMKLHDRMLFTGIITDISDLVEKEEQIKEYLGKLEVLNDELSEANSTKDKFFSIIAHDLRSPFNSLLGIVDIFESDYHKLSEDNKLEFVKSINSSIKNAYKLIENLLEWARLQIDGIEIKKKYFNIHELVSSIEELVVPRAKKKGIKIENKTDTNSQVFADRTSLNTVIRNLVTNSVKFSNEGDTIKIYSNKGENYFDIVVEDTGIGMDDETVHNLFKIDVKKSQQGTAKEKGTGLGLILSKEFIEKHGGKLFVESKKNVGSKFTISLPTNSNN